MTASRHLDVSRLRSQLLAPVGPYAAIDVVERTGSTNADLRAAVAEGAPDRTVLIAEEQTAGAGRRGRGWVSPPGRGVYLSVLLRPAEVPMAALGSLAAVAGLALTDVTDALGVDAVLKWPNDVLAGAERAKCAGVLAEAVSSDEQAVVLGIGVNVLPLRDSRTGQTVRPGPGGLPATSLAEQHARTTDRTDVAALLLAALHERELPWRQARGDLAAAGLLDEYRERCATLGQQIRLEVAGAQSRLGTAVDVDPTGALVVDEEGKGRRTVFAADVIHLRSLPG
ncbi:biotin--[acetyl-CoA-carboxylase] ligase [Saccharomonospora xinjiangensis]|uniref:biotin--[acetyl-CoA-carboxylase] ligase n=1 Tax=Saccharomonospora xinjiangensis TaxID=75294 RepID=UPI00350EF30F